MKLIKNLFIIILASFLMFGCEEDLPDTSNSIFDIEEEPKNAFDNWLYENYLNTFNIDYMYRLDDTERNFGSNLSPAELSQSMRLAVIIKHAWLDAYVEVAGMDFLRQNAPAILHVIGSASWNTDGTITLGTAEGGLKITMYMANWLNPSNVAEMNEYYFKTMHHEFTHILQQNINYPQDYNTISASDYSPSAWFNRGHISQYAPFGFVTSYAGSSAVEDITEVTACYITFTDAQWDAVYAAAGVEGSNKLDQKIQIMKDYMSDSWDIDMDELRNVVARRMDEIINLQLIIPEWEHLLDPTSNSEQIRHQAMAYLKENFISNWGSISEELATSIDVCHIHEANAIQLLEDNNTSILVDYDE